MLERGATVTGRVFDAQGRPAAGVWVRVEEEGPGARFKRPPSATTGGEGRYQLEGVETGSRLISATNEERKSATEEIEVGPGVNRLDLRFAAGVRTSAAPNGGRRHGRFPGLPSSKTCGARTRRRPQS